MLPCLCMPTPLPRISTLIADTWNAFLKNWETMLKTSIWVIPATILMGSTEITKTTPAIYAPIFAILSTIGIVISLWVTIRLYRTTFAIEAGKTDMKDTIKSDIQFFLPFIVIAGLSSIATGIGFIFLILPGIYLAIRLAFVELIVIEERVQAKGVVPFLVAPLAVLAIASIGYAVMPNKIIGLSAVALSIAYMIYGLYMLYTLNKEPLLASWLLTKNRFWPVFNRQVIGILLLGLVVGVVANVSLWIVQIISGFDLSASLNSNQPSPASILTFGAISGLIQAAFIPAICFFEVKLFRSLQKTR